MGEGKRPNKVLNAFRAFPKLVDRFFVWYGGYVADHAVWFITLPLLVTLVLAPGITQLRRITDDIKIWPMAPQFSINDVNSKNYYNKFEPICTCVRCDEYGENCNKTIDCGDETPKNCKGAADGVDFTCPHLQLMFITRNKSMTDPDMLEELLQLDMQVTFAKYSIQRFRPAFFASNVSDWQICQKRQDGSCIQFSILTGVRQQLAKLPGLQDYEAQTKFLFDLQNDPEKQESFREMMMSQSSKPIYYPFDSSQSNALFIGPIYGDVTMQRPNETWGNGIKAGKVKHIGAMQMLYCLNASDSMQETNMNWTRYITKWLEERYTNNKSFNKFDLMVASTWSRVDRNGDEIVRMVPYLLICILSLMLFCGLTTLRGYPAHRTLPWIGPIGVGTSVLGVGASFGLVGWMEWEIVDLCFAIPILVLAVGIDDVFVYTDSWRATKPEWLIRKRVAVTMKVACPGIVVTSFMNSLAFIIDTQSPFFALQIFSNVSVISALFDFVFQMTLFPACLALLSQVEKKNRNACCCCFKVKARTNANYRKENICYIMCCTAPKSTILKRESGVIMSDDEKSDKESGGGKTKAIVAKKATPLDDGTVDAQKSKETQKAQHFFADVYTPILLKPSVSLVAMIFYAGYLSVCLYLSSWIHVGLRFENMAPERPDGELNEIQIYLKHFRNFSFPIDIMFNKRLDYWNNATQLAINSLFDDVTKVPHVGPDIIGRNWLRDFVHYAKQRNMDISTEEGFLYHLREKFFREPKARQDMLFDVKFADRTMPDYEQMELDYHGWKMPPIVASRLVVWGVDVNDMTISGDVVRKLRDVRRKHEDGNLNVTFYSREFVDTEPMLATGWIVMYNTLIQLAAVLLVTAFMMPHPVALFWIAVMLSSITFGVITITCAWSIDFDQVAMINIMLTMGYCVDFSAHMTRTYVSSKGKTRYEKTREAIAEFGFAVVQSSVAAILAVLCLGASYSYILRCGFKFFFVGILLSDFHTLVVFPVFLLYLGPQPLQQKRKSKRSGKRRKNRSNNDEEDITDENVIDARKMTKEIERSMRRDKKKREAKLGQMEIASIDSKLSSIANGPPRRIYIPDLSRIPPLAEIVETSVVPSAAAKMKMAEVDAMMMTIGSATMDIKTFALINKGELTLSIEDETVLSSSSSPLTNSNYEKPPPF